MPGRRPIDINQQTHDVRGILKGSLTALPDHAYALKSGGLDQFASTTSEQLSQVISDETGSGNLVFNINANLITPSLNNTSTIITGRLLTGSTTANQILLSFPKFDVNSPTQVYGCAEVIVQSEVGDTTGTFFPSSVVSRKITKFLLVFDHANNIVLHNEYAGLNTSGTSLGTWNFISNTTTFDFVITPANNSTTLHNAIAFCFNSIDNVWVSF